MCEAHSGLAASGTMLAPDTFTSLFSTCASPACYTQQRILQRRPIDNLPHGEGTLGLLLREDRCANNKAGNNFRKNADFQDKAKPISVIYVWLFAIIRASACGQWREKFTSMMSVESVTVESEWMLSLREREAVLVVGRGLVGVNFCHFFEECLKP
jgi:hypothetical protein